VVEAPRMAGSLNEFSRSARRYPKGTVEAQLPASQALPQP
jgi:hypothetical protein